MIPPPLDHIRRVFPSESAIDGLVRINQMGASLSEVRADWVYCDLFLHCAGRSATADFARCHSLDPTPSNVPTIAVLVAPAAAAGILLFLILGSGVTAARPGRRPDHRNQDRAGDQRPPGSLLGHPRAERASRRRPRRARQPRARRGRLRLAQDLDEATAAVGTAPAKLAAAEETYQAAHLGPTREELAIIDAKVTNAETTVAVIAARAAKLRIRAPADGIVARLVAEPGEAIIPGQPVMTLEATGRRWARFNLREDQLDGLRIGSPAELPPVGGSDPSAARVTEIIARGEFATWRAPRVVGDYDLNTFLVRVDPVPTAGVLQPGMSVWLQPTRPAE